MYAATAAEGLSVGVGAVLVSTHGLLVRVRGVSEEVEAADEEEHNILFSLSLYHSSSTQPFPCYQSTVNERVAVSCSQIAHVPLDGVAAVLCGESN